MTEKPPPKPDVPGPDSLTERLNTWKNRASLDSYTDRVVRGAQVTDGQAHAVRAVNDLVQRGKVPAVPYPQVGDEASIPCPHCDGPMYVTNVIHDSIVIECPKCSGTKGPTT